MKDLIIRKANPDDALGINIVQAFVWKTTYRGLIPEDKIENKIIAIKDKYQKWKETIKMSLIDSSTSGYYVATIDNTIIGFITYFEAKDEEYAGYGEIGAFYILKSFQGLGIGKKLFLKAFEDLSKKGFKKVIIKCVKDNPSVEIYEHLGGKIIDTISKDGVNEVVLLYTL